MREQRLALLPEGRSEVALASVHKDWRKIAKTARSEGWAIFINGAGKLAWWGPDGTKFATALTPPRRGATMKNYVQQLRRHGVPGA